MLRRINWNLTRSLLVGVTICALVSPVSAQTGIVSGKVTDAATGLPLIGANVLLSGTAIGHATDTGGAFEILNLAPGGYVLQVSFIGYTAQESEIVVTADEQYVWNVALVPGTDLDPVQVTAGRRNEKVLDAPASIDVLTARDYQLDVAQTMARSLRNVTGLDIVQTGVDRYEIVLRGFNNVFSRTTHILTDYRKAGAASVGVNLNNIMPGLAMDTERVEVVRGPGSALYGPGGDTGVIHYISKDAFNYPGTTISVSGGQQSMFNVQGRIATVLGQRVGVKLIGNYAVADDFALHDCDRLLLEAERFSECPDPEDAVQLFVDGPREVRQRKLVLSGGMDWRIRGRTTLSLNGGVANLDGTMLSSIGTVQAKGLITSYAQLRLSSGPLFVQAYVNAIDSRDSYVYGGDRIQEVSEEYAVQAQYTQVIGARQELVAGVDLTLEHVDKFGAYLQSTTKISDRLELILALRGDYNNVVTEIQASPRVALVLKPAPTSSLRATYNRSFSSPLATDYFLNLLAASIGDLNVRARGGASGFTYARNPDYLALGASTSLVASSMLPGMEGVPTPVGMDTGVMYRLIYEGLVAIPDEELARRLADAELPIPASFIPLLKQGLRPEVTPVEGFSPGTLALPNLSTLELIADPKLNNLPDLEPIKPAMTQSWELGYKGIIDDKVLFAVDGYFAKRENFIGPLQAKTPFVLIPNLQQDLIRDISAGLAANEEVAGVLGLLNLTPEEGAEILVNVAGSDLPDSETPVAIVQTNENNRGIGHFPELMLTYPVFGNIRYFGMDISMQVLASDAWRFFGNASWVSDDYFDHTELEEESEDLELALNAPGFKFKLGGQYQRESGISLTASGRFTKGFPVIAGQYIGEVASYMIIDAGVGYAMHKTGIRADFGVNNLFNSNHREFVGAPRLGRVAALRLTYTTGH